MRPVTLENLTLGLRVCWKGAPDEFGEVAFYSVSPEGVTVLVAWPEGDTLPFRLAELMTEES